jgi:Branched-chain amino acid transport system / permease component
MKRVFGLLALAAFALVLPFQLGASALTTATFVVIAATAATGLNVLTGYAGQISLGHAFFLAAGAYTGAVLGADHGLSAALWIPAAGIVAAIFGALVGPMALRLKGLYLAIVTLGVIFIAQHVLLNAPGISGGPQGRAFPPITIGSFDFSPGQTLQLGGMTIDHDGLYYYFALLVLALATAFTWSLRRSRSGRAMLAVREREIPAALMGVNVEGHGVRGRRRARRGRRRDLRVVPQLRAADAVEPGALDPVHRGHHRRRDGHDRRPASGLVRGVRAAVAAQAPAGPRRPPVDRLRPADRRLPRPRTKGSGRVGRPPAFPITNQKEDQS